MTDGIILSHKAVEVAWNYIDTLPDYMEKDREDYQADIVASFIRKGDLLSAEIYTVRMKTWRKGTLLADIAKKYAEKGDLKKASFVLNRARIWREFIREKHKDGTYGWTVDRIGIHILDALLAMDNLLEAREILDSLPAFVKLQYSGRLIPAMQQLSFEEKINELHENQALIEAAPEKTSGHVQLTENILNLASIQQTGSGNYSNAVAEAQTVIDKLPLEQRLEQLFNLLSLHQPNSRKSDEVSEIFEKIESDVIKGNSWQKATGLAKLAILYMEYGDQKKARECCDLAALAAQKVSPADRPSAYVLIAGCYYRLGYMNLSDKWFEKFNELLRGQENKIPRAKALALWAATLVECGLSQDTSQIEEVESTLGSKGKL